MSFDKCTFFRPIFSVWSFGLTLGLIFSFALGGCSSSSTPRGSLSISNLEQTRSEARLAKAVEVYRTMISSTDSGVPEALLQRSQCIVIMPEVLKAAFFAGGRIGKGIATCRASDNKNDKKYHKFFLYLS